MTTISCYFVGGPWDDQEHPIDDYSTQVTVPVANYPVASRRARLIGHHLLDPPIFKLAKYERSLQVPDTFLFVGEQ